MKSQEMKSQEQRIKDVKQVMQNIVPGLPSYDYDAAARMILEAADRESLRSENHQLRAENQQLREFAEWVVSIGGPEGTDTIGWVTMLPHVLDRARRAALSGKEKP